MNVAVCEDQKEHLERVLKVLEQMKEKWNLHVDAFRCGEDLLRKIEDKSIEQYDLFILDIELPGIRGIELAENIRIVNEKALFMFLTSFDKYQVEAFGMRVVAYIDKPVTVQKLEYYFEKNKIFIQGMESYFTFKSDYEDYKIKCSEIIYLSIDGRYLTIVTHQKSYTTNMTIKEALIQLDEDTFVRTHKSFVVNMSYVQRVENDDVLMKNGDKVVLSRKFKKLLQEKHLRLIREVL